MKAVLNSMVEVVNDQRIALGNLADQITGLKRTLARQFPDLAEDLKAQIEADQDQSRTTFYELQVSLAKLREAIVQLPDSPAAAATPKARFAKRTQRGVKKAKPAA